ncbi:M48 family metallopeptidase [Vineibacter terrae]|uniref:M48 family metallopeptidase n=1 Tax=Vineibacter terrae TaxID=2586908 RepID=UPI002E2FAE2F|nr:M48 family metallopeptidase [Vineibacter terrae]HEX2890695.1 M48 family metallopeptidase [Vineibacter terrae]
MARIVRSVVALSVLAALAACESAPITGRSRLAPIGDQELRAQASQLYRDELSKHRLSNDTEHKALVERVGRRIAQAAEMPPEGLWRAPGFQWEFNVIDEPGVVNAYCLPGGKIAVYTGLFPVSRDENGLAIVMGHEVAHALMRHHGERIADQMAVGTASTLGGAILGAIIGGRDDRASGAAAGAGLAIAGNLVLLDFSRTQESEADRVGLILAAHAGYDPRAAVGLWERMRSASNSRGGRPPELLSTHPAEETRIAEIRRHLPEALQYYQGQDR